MVGVCPDPLDFVHTVVCAAADEDSGCTVALGGVFALA